MQPELAGKVARVDSGRSLACGPVTKEASSSSEEGW